MCGVIVSKPLLIPIDTFDTRFPGRVSIKTPCKGFDLIPTPAFRDGINCLDQVQSVAGEAARSIGVGWRAASLGGKPNDRRKNR